MGLLLYRQVQKTVKLQRTTGIDNSTGNIMKNNNAGNNLENLLMAETKEVLQQLVIKILINFIDILVWPILSFQLMQRQSIVKTSARSWESPEIARAKTVSDCEMH